ITDQTALGVKAQEYMDKGDLVPDQLVQDMVEERLQKSDAQKGWILDGFPRTVSQAVFLGNLLDRIQGDSERVVNLDAPDEIVVSRLLGRGRKDDSEDVIRHRLNVYRRDTAPLIQYYGDRQKLLTVNGNQSQEEVTSALKMAITVLRK
ncbi:nucleoside monophosphate kinase, partial [Cylindrospermopsis raciborskii CS-506_C]